MWLFFFPVDKDVTSSKQKDKSTRCASRSRASCLIVLWARKFAADSRMTQWLRWRRGAGDRCLMPCWWCWYFGDLCQFRIWRTLDRLTIEVEEKHTCRRIRIFLYICIKNRAKHIIVVCSRQRHKPALHSNKRQEPARHRRETNYLSSILFDWEPTTFSRGTTCLRQPDYEMLCSCTRETAPCNSSLYSGAAQPHFHRYMGFTLIVWTLSMTWVDGPT
jgi:hypothetical protein